MTLRGRTIRRIGSASLLAVCLALGASNARAQPWGRFGWFRVPPRFPTADSFDGRFNWCRLMYQSVRREDGGMGWWTDYPAADRNIMIRLAELTKASVAKDLTGDPNFLVVRPTDDALYRCPMISIEDAGTAEFDEIEVERLREYFLKGGFMWVDDYWGSLAWDEWAREIGKVLPPEDYPIFDIPPDHPIMHSLFDLKAVPQIPSIQHWRRSGGDTSERGSDSADVHFRGIADREGRLMVVMTHNTDIADGWEREGESTHYFYRFSIESYAVAMDIIMYAMTH